jgi:hypothetical protein
MKNGISKLQKNTSETAYGVGYIVGNTTGSLIKGTIDGIKDAGLSIKDFSINMWDNLVEWIQ